MKGTDTIRELGPALRRRREELGLSLDEVAIATRIPVAHLKAIELERPQDLPAGPYAQAYARALMDHLELELSEEGGIQEAHAEVEAPVESPAMPLGVVRVVGGVSAVAVVATVGVLSWMRFVPERPEVVVVPDQHLTVTARRSGKLRAEVDGEVVHDGVLPGGQSVELVGHERVAVTVDSTSAFVFAWNDEVIVPQGLQDHPRTLVFIDDVGPPPSPADKRGEPSVRTAGEGTP